jgi:hypothetical protein
MHDPTFYESENASSLLENQYIPFMEYKNNGVQFLGEFGKIGPYTYV